METRCVYCEVRNQFLYITHVEASSQAFSGRRHEMISALSAAEAQTFSSCYIKEGGKMPFIRYDANNFSVSSSSFTLTLDFNQLPS